MIRTPEVIDCWYDSGAMPFAQWGYPHKEGSVEKFEAAYPADFIAEAIDQTRGWFYTLMAIGTLVFDESSYKTVLCLGHILDKDGRKMSKHLGNVLEPISLMDQHGADAVRWYMLAAGSPWSARRVGHDAITEVIRKTLLTYWNTVSFFTLYAKASGAEITEIDLRDPDLTMMDKWIISELHQLIASVDAAYTEYESQEAGKLIARFIDDLSNWYIRRNRRRFWDGEAKALSLLYYCLKELTLLMAPMVPFITEHMWQTLIRKVETNSPESIHLANFPIADAALIDLELMENIQLTRRFVELGRAARAESKVKIRQPLARALVAAQGWEKISPQVRSSLREQISEELNVVNVSEIDSQNSDLVNISIKANFKSLGAKYGANVQAISKAVVAANAAELVTTLRNVESTLIVADGVEYSITLDDLVVTETPKEGWSFASHNGESVALDLQLTPELIESGLVREIIRAIQEGRKNAGLDVSDRIAVSYQASAEVVSAFANHNALICDEVLAVSLHDSLDGSAPFTSTVEEIGLTFTITRA
jgi:isoleucyl-tRNA synthetase